MRVMVADKIVEPAHHQLLHRKGLRAQEDLLERT
jgi:hypothetical protein